MILEQSSYNDVLPFEFKKKKLTMGLSIACYVDLTFLTTLCIHMSTPNCQVISLCWLINLQCSGNGYDWHSTLNCSWISFLCINQDCGLCTSMTYRTILVWAYIILKRAMHSMSTPSIDRKIHRHTSVHVCMCVYIHIYMPTNMYAHDSLSIA